MNWQWLLRALSLDEVLAEARDRPDEERLFLVEQLLAGLDRARRGRALTNAAYRCSSGVQLELWQELGHWLGDASSPSAEALAGAICRLDQDDQLAVWEMLCDSVGAAIPARERYGALARGSPRQARLPTRERDGLLLALEPEALDDPRSVFYARKRYLELLKHFALLQTGFEDALAGGVRMLEIGPGEHAGVAALFAARGARATMVDVEPLLELDDAAYYERLMSVMDCGGPFDWAAVLGFDGRGVRFTSRLGYLAPVSEDSLPLRDACIGAAYSGAALEHVRDLDRLCAELFRVLEPGAPMVHLLDLSDHRVGASHGPLSHLCMGEDAWAAVDSDAGYFQSRRLCGEYLASFGRAGFGRITIEVLGRAEVTADVRARLDAPFAGLPDEAINPLDAYLCAVKPG